MGDYVKAKIRFSKNGNFSSFQDFDVCQSYTLFQMLGAYSSMERECVLNGLPGERVPIISPPKGLPLDILESFKQDLIETRKTSDCYFGYTEPTVEDYICEIFSLHEVFSVSWLTIEEIQQFCGTLSDEEKLYNIRFDTEMSNLKETIDGLLTDINLEIEREHGDSAVILFGFY